MANRPKIESQTKYLDFLNIEFTEAVKNPLPET
jgi:hypothetical protein